MGREFWYSTMRPASYNPTVPIGERKPLFANSEEEARAKVEAMPPDIVNGKEYKRGFISPRT